MTTLAVDLDGRLWVGTEGAGVYCRTRSDASGSGWTQFTCQNGIGDDCVYALAVDLRGPGMGGPSDFRRFRLQRRCLAKLQRTGGSDRGARVCVAVSLRDGDVWIATSAGLTRYSAEADNWRHYTRADGLPADDLRALTFGADGTLYVGTAYGGVAVAESEDDYRRWRTIARREDVRPPLTSVGEGLPSNCINALLAARDGSVYAGTTAGLARSFDRGHTWTFFRERTGWTRFVGSLEGSRPTGRRSSPGRP